MALTYELLLDLYRGKSTAVEQIGNPAALKEMAIETPVTRLLERVERDGTPRHVVLTGAAGDGKTFAALTAQVSSFHVITDASARRSNAHADIDPVDDVIAQIEGALTGGKRLLLAVNRGQLERLFERRERTNSPQARALLEVVRTRITPREVWESAGADVAVVDLSHLDRAPTIAAMLGKVIGIEDSPLTAIAPRTSFSVAKEGLKTARVASWVTAVVRSAASAGRNVTMRQMWSFLAFLATGARAVDDTRPLSLDDAVGARLFSGNSDNPLFAAARELDPALQPDAQFAKRVLTGAFDAEVKASPLGALATASTAEVGALQGRQAIRIAAVHGLGAKVMLPGPTDHYADACKRLLESGPGWHSIGYTKRLVTGIYDWLGMWRTNNSTPAWEVLCYDASLLDGAALVADRQLEASKFQLAAPRPPPEVSAELLQSWRPPFIWLGTKDGARLRLFPQAFRALMEPTTLAISREDLFAADRWVARNRTAGAAPENQLRVARRGDADCLVVDEDDIAQDRVVLSIEGGVSTGVER